MNRIPAIVKEIKSVDNLTVVTFESNGEELRMMALGLNLTVEKGSRVVLGAKASNTALAKNLSGMISISNQLPCTIVSINRGSLLCSIKVKYNDVSLESIITLSSAQQMNLEVGQRISLLIKASELSILEVLS